MISETQVSWEFFDGKDAKDSGDLKWTVNKIEDVVPTGKWRFTHRDGKKMENSEMSVEVTYTQVTVGKIYVEKKEPFLKFFTRTTYDDTERRIVKEKNRIKWVNEYHVEFRTITTHECFGDM